MSADKTIKNFTAADIEKYWNKNLSSAEMHEMEKAALNDPFLADALEGFKYSSNAGKELAILREKFDNKIRTGAPVIPVQRRKNAWLKIAAAIIVFAGAGLVVQQLVLKNKAGTSIANLEKTKEDKTIESTKTNEVVQNNPTDTAKTTAVSTQPATTDTEKKQVITSDLNSSFALTTIDSLKSDGRNKNFDKRDVTLQRNDAAPVKEAEKREALDETASAPKSVADSASLSLKQERNANAAMKTRAFAEGVTPAGVLNNRFNYRVVDAQNNPVPFANVMSTRDNVGTYTDIRGYFNLVSSDSILDVQVKSLGYNSEHYRLSPSKQPHDLVLNEDATAKSEMSLDNRSGRVMSNVSRKDSAEVEEPEVGWGNYNTYVENNIKIPDNVRSKNGLNEVELSFDVDKSGQPTNIKVTRSSRCKECDEEAKRLLKEGPKWKRKGRNFKTTISIAVDQK